MTIIELTDIENNLGNYYKIIKSNKVGTHHILSVL